MPEIRLIDANAEIERLKATYCECCERCKPWGIFGAACAPCWVMDAIEEFEDAPTIDAEPVKHGYWEESPTGNKNFNYCSVCCGAIQRYDNETFTYCPHCGAKMDGGANDDAE